MESTNDDFVHLDNDLLRLRLELQSTLISILQAISLESWFGIFVWEDIFAYCMNAKEEINNLESFAFSSHEDQRKIFGMVLSLILYTSESLKINYSNTVKQYFNSLLPIDVK